MTVFPTQQQPQDELAGLFARTMTLNPMTPPPDESMQHPPPPPAATAAAADADDQKQVVYTSMHYTHTRHVVPVRFQPPRTASSPTPEPQQPQQPEHQALSDAELLHLLAQNSIDPHALFPSQVHLLRHADGEQRLRLLELWRISPPGRAPYDLAKQQERWAARATSVQQEEEMARARYERIVAEQQGVFHNPPDQEQRGSLEVATPPDRPATAPGLRSSHAEPYMLSGYEYLSRRDYDQPPRPLAESTRYNQATDPVYLGGKGGQENYQQDEEMEL